MGIAVVLAVAFYTVLAVQGIFPLSYLPIYIAAAYLVWMLLLLGREEQRLASELDGLMERWAYLEEIAEAQQD